MCVAAEVVIRVASTKCLRAVDPMMISLGLAQEKINNVIDESHLSVNLGITNNNNSNHDSGIARFGQY